MVGVSPVDTGGLISFLLMWQDIAGPAHTLLQALTTFPEKITLDNLKAVGKLQGVGKGSLEKVRGVWEQCIGS
jgi:hypothetical protein